MTTNNRKSRLECKLSPAARMISNALDEFGSETPIHLAAQKYIDRAYLKSGEIDHTNFERYIFFTRLLGEMCEEMPKLRDAWAREVSSIVEKRYETIH